MRALQRDALAECRQLLVRRELDHAVVPCRVAADTGLGGERLVVLLLVMVSVLAIQDVVISIFLIQEEAITAPTDALPTRLVVILTILEFTAFSTIFYRLLPPEKFRTFARRSGASPEQSPSHQSMSLMKFVGVVLDPSTTVWKSKVSYVNLNAIESTSPRWRCARHRADACTGTTSRRWLGAPEIRLPRRSTMFRVNRGALRLRLRGRGLGLVRRPGPPGRRRGEARREQRARAREAVRFVMVKTTRSLIEKSAAPRRPLRFARFGSGAPPASPGAAWPVALMKPWMLMGPPRAGAGAASRTRRVGAEAGGST